MYPDPDFTPRPGFVETPRGVIVNRLEGRSSRDNYPQSEVNKKRSRGTEVYY